MNTYKILIADDYPLTVKGYSLFIDDFYNNKTVSVNIDTAFNCKECFQKLFSEKALEYDIVLLDISMPPFEENKIFSGEDIGLFIRKNKPNTKLIVITGLVDNHRLYTIFKNINPDGILIKTDINENSFINAIQDVLNNKTHYSHKSTELLRSQFTIPYVLDDVDRGILYFLSVGIKVNNLPNKIFLSVSGVEKRIRKLREYFEVESTSVLSLILKSKEKGFL